MLRKLEGCEVRSVRSQRRALNLAEGGELATAALVVDEEPNGEIEALVLIRTARERAESDIRAIVLIPTPPPHTSRGSCSSAAGDCSSR